MPPRRTGKDKGREVEGPGWDRVPTRVSSTRPGFKFELYPGRVDIMSQRAADRRRAAAPPQPQVPAVIRERPFVLMTRTSREVERVLEAIVARGLAATHEEAAHVILHSYAEDYVEATTQRDPPEAPARVDGVLARDRDTLRGREGWVGEPGQTWAAEAPGLPAAELWQGRGYLWRGRPPGAACGHLGAFRRVVDRLGERVVFERMRAERFLPLELAGWSWCPADGAGRLVGW